jgi:hypothetical protein
MEQKGISKYYNSLHLNHKRRTFELGESFTSWCFAVYCKKPVTRTYKGAVTEG